MRSIHSLSFAQGSRLWSGAFMDLVLTKGHVTAAVMSTLAKWDLISHLIRQIIALIGRCE